MAPDFDAAAMNFATSFYQESDQIISHFRENLALPTFSPWIMIDLINNTIPHEKLSRRALLMSGASIFLMPLNANADDRLVAHVTSPRILGKADAPIKVIELFSMTCSHCASFHNNTFPDVKKRLIDTDIVCFEMQPFPLDRVARASGCRTSRALPQSKYFAMVALFLKNIDRWARNPDPLVEAFTNGTAGRDERGRI